MPFALSRDMSLGTPRDKLMAASVERQWAKSLRSSVQMLDPHRASRWAIPNSGGKFRNVGDNNPGLYADEEVATDLGTGYGRAASRAGDDDDDDAHSPHSVASRPRHVASAASLRGVRSRLHAPTKSYQSSQKLAALSKSQSAPRLQSIHARAWH